MPSAAQAKGQVKKSGILVEQWSGAASLYGAVQTHNQEA
jgi:hypothetical protein